MSAYGKIHAELMRLADSEKRSVLMKFFKTGPGQYSEGDRFLGVTVVQQRTLARNFKDVSLDDLRRLLDSPWHEERMMAVLFLGRDYPKSDQDKKKKLFDLYFDKIYAFNNWDLVDMSAHKVVGAYLRENRKSIAILKKLAKSKNLWHRRIAIMSTFAHINGGSYGEIMEIADILLYDQHDLIHKAVGWMLREVGKRDMEAEESFLRTRYRKMPRTMLRYAIEKFPKNRYKAYLNGEA